MIGQTQRAQLEERGFREYSNGRWERDCRYTSTSLYEVRNPGHVEVDLRLYVNSLGHRTYELFRFSAPLLAEVLSEFDEFARDDPEFVTAIREKFTQEGREVPNLGNPFVSEADREFLESRGFHDDGHGYFRRTTCEGSLAQYGTSFQASIQWREDLDEWTLRFWRDNRIVSTRSEDTVQDVYQWYQCRCDGSSPDYLLDWIRQNNSSLRSAEFVASRAMEAARHRANTHWQHSGF